MTPPPRPPLPPPSRHGGRSRPRAALLGALATWLAASGSLPPENPGGSPGDRAGTDALRANLARAWTEGAGGARPTLARGASGAHALVLLVAFSDTAWAAPDLHTSEHFDSLLFGEGGRSVRTYMDEISMGRFALTGEVHPVRELPISLSAYTVDPDCPTCCCGLGPYPRNAQKLVEDLVAASDAAVDFGRHDGDGDGVVDLLFVVHAGVDVADRPVPRQLASHQWHTVEAPLADGVRVEGYALLSEWSGIGGFAHEMLHLFGVPDLWDLTCCSHGLGDWSLMAAGARLGVPRYSDPAHPDAWTRLRLGFAATARVDAREGSGLVTLSPVASSGQVLRVDPGAREGVEYFLIENRRSGAGTFDGHLPGEGLLIYHVDERVALNTDPRRYRVALEQADGRFDLEFPEFQDLLGDRGDPFPGDSARTRFDDDTWPSARTHGGARSGFRVDAIALGASDASFVLERAEAPVLDAVIALGAELSGDGDLRPETGELWSVDLDVVNLGADAASETNGSLHTEPPSSGNPPGVTIPPLGTGEAHHVEGAFAITLPELGADPGALVAILALDSPELADSVRTFLVTGSVYGLEPESFEAGLGRWRHDLVSLGAADPWHVSTRRAAAGSASLACADVDGGEYPDSIDAAAISPPVLLGAGSALTFRHFIDAESAPPNDAFDGARIEVSADGVRFSPVAPRGGYTHVPPTNAAFPLFDTPVFSGRSLLDPACEAGWCDVRADLSAFDGTPIWLRFRFGSDHRTGAEGWFIDEVAVETDGSSVAFHIFEPFAGQEAVHVDWSVVENLRAFSGTIRFERERVDRDEGPPIVLSLDTFEGTRRVSVVDAPIPRGASWRYRLIEVDAGGAADSVRAERTLSRPALPPRPSLASVRPMPFGTGGSVLRIELTASSAGPLAAAFHDVSGRVVERRTGVIAPDGTQVIEWDGRDRNGRLLPPGVYFFRIPGVASGRVVLLR